MDTDQSFDHTDALAFLNRNAPLREKLIVAHQSVQQSLPFIARIALTLYDTDTRVLRSYLHSGGDHEPMEHYQAIIDSASSLVEVLKRGHPRVINNMLTTRQGKHEHSRRIGHEGYEASYSQNPERRPQDHRPYYPSPRSRDRQPPRSYVALQPIDRRCAG